MSINDEDSLQCGLVLHHLKKEKTTGNSYNINTSQYRGEFTNAKHFQTSSSLLVPNKIQCYCFKNKYPNHSIDKSAFEFICFHWFYLKTIWRLHIILHFLNKNKLNKRKDIMKTNGNNRWQATAINMYLKQNHCTFQIMYVRIRCINNTVFH